MKIFINRYCNLQVVGIDSTKIKTQTNHPHTYIINKYIMRIVLYGVEGYLLCIGID